MSKSIVLMTALVPTIGHEALVRFAEIASATFTHVIISGRSFEPVSIEQRIDAFRDTFLFVEFYEHLDDNAPQTPTTPNDPVFWEYWKNVVIQHVGPVNPDDLFVTSEPYGVKMAEVLGCNFMPFDLNRSFIKARGTTVRSDMDEYWDLIMPEFRRQIKQTVTFFGSESCGKSTMTKLMSRYFGARYTDEWARPYLELVGPETTEKHMEMILEGQYALQLTAHDDIRSFYTFQDTDLLSTIGYYHLMGMKAPVHAKDYFTHTKSDLYIVMNDQIPFEPDILRYGGDKRTSTTQFWTDLLDEYDCNYYVVQKTNLEDQIWEILPLLSARKAAYFRPIENFVRES